MAYNEVSETQLLALLKEGDEGAFTEIYNRHWETMAGYAIRLTRSIEESADIIQEIFVSLWRRRVSLEVKGPLVAYLIKATRNLCLKYLEKNLTKHQFLERLSLWSDKFSNESEEQLDLKQLQAQLDESVALLPDKMRTIYLLSRNEQLSHREIAQRLGIAEGTVKKQINYALKIISAAFKTQLYGTAYILFIYLLKAN